MPKMVTILLLFMTVATEAGARQLDWDTDCNPAKVTIFDGRRSVKEAMELQSACSELLMRQPDAMNPVRVKPKNHDMSDGPSRDRTPCPARATTQGDGIDGNCNSKADPDIIYKK